MHQNSSPFYVPERAMVIMAHPDDPEFSCSGTIARWTSHGAKVCYVLVTSGDVGIAARGMTRERAIEIREREQMAAAKVCGVEEVVFLREPDGMVVPTLELRKKLVREIRRFRPEVVICGDPTVVWAGANYINHPDHRAAATAAVDAIFPAAGQPNLFEEIEMEDGFLAHKPRKVMVSTWAQDPDVFINITETISKKIAALRAHESQMTGWDPEPMVREWAAERARGKEMEFAEAFKVVTLESDEEWLKWKGDVVGRENGATDEQPQVDS
ncbi:MAG TPA: PIG-L deacetylase family protein [Anaerolineales bacterium]|nr:PIG-L deacetylase family protein [Anaerolineales bacterium]